MGDMVVMNVHLLAVLNYTLSTWISSGAELRIFQNDFEPGPDSLLSEFIPATYGGYAPVDLAAEWGTPFKVVDGMYQVDSSEFEFEYTGIPTQYVYGWYIVQTSGTPSVRMCGRFPAPVFMNAGVTFKIIVSPQSWSLSIIEV